MAYGKVIVAGQAALKRQQDQQTAQDLGDADVYRKALEKAIYGGLAPAFNQGISGIQGYLSHSGPLADSGARAALTARLASGLYGNAASQVGQGYASYLGNVLNQRRQFAYQMALLKAQKKMQQTGIGGTLGGLAGIALGGPLGGALGAYAGNKLFGGGNPYGSDPYNLFNYGSGGYGR